MEDTIFISAKDLTPDYLEHHGVLGMKWGVRRYQNKDGSLTSSGRSHYGIKQRIKKTVTSDSFKRKAKIIGVATAIGLAGTMGAAAAIGASRIPMLIKTAELTDLGIKNFILSDGGLMVLANNPTEYLVARSVIKRINTGAAAISGLFGTSVGVHAGIATSGVHAGIATSIREDTKKNKNDQKIEEVNHTESAKQDLKAPTAKKINYEDYRGEKGTTRLSRDLYNIEDSFHTYNKDGHLNNEQSLKEQSRLFVNHANNVIKGSRKEDRKNLVKEFSGTIDGGMYDAPAVTVYDTKNNKILAYDYSSSIPYDSEDKLRKYYSASNPNVNWVERPKSDSKLEFYSLGESIGAQNYANNYLKIHPDSNLSYDELIDTYEKNHQ